MNSLYFIIGFFSGSLWTLAIQSTIRLYKRKKNQPITDLQIGDRVTSSGKYINIDEEFRHSNGVVTQIKPVKAPHAGNAFITVNMNGSIKQFYKNALKKI